MTEEKTRNAYEAHVVAEQPAAAFLVPLPEELDAVALVVAKIGVDARGYLDCVWLLFERFRRDVKGDLRGVW